MFAMKSMGDSLLKLKLDMVYRDLPVEEAGKRYAELTTVPVPPAAEKPKPKRKVIKALVPTK
jgi:hypothetical protein